ncbi:expressed unknown protein [Seminavis robusta]|uniref:VWFD domain-containing protein n=1 Tax=Seminavis robusta TaxID=568900 RepID=A0A9N8DHN4_9STRA|nr:expressed unknown protein [Seminavis robusta]|eukprot:Sro132_g062810.1 n/a (465) ;mRNA; f:104724-106532
MFKLLLTATLLWVLPEVAFGVNGTVRAGVGSQALKDGIVDSSVDNLDDALLLNQVDSRHRQLAGPVVALLWKAGSAIGTGEYEDDDPATIEGTVKVATKIGNVDAWNFSLTFRYEDGWTEDGLFLNGWVKHLMKPTAPGHERDLGTFGREIVVSNYIKNEWNSDATIGSNGGRPWEKHPGDVHYDCVTKNFMETVGSINSWSFVLVASHVDSLEAKGDPHFQTWSGRGFDYHGECDLVLLSAPNFLYGPLDIHIRTKSRYDYSYIETAAVRIGEDILEVSSWGDYALNGVDGALGPNGHEVPILGGYSVSYRQADDKRHVFEIRNDKVGAHIKVSSFKDWVNVEVLPVPPESFVGSFGLMGSFPTGQMLARNGKTVMDDPKAVGQEWQVLPSEPSLFRVASSGSDRCILPDQVKASKARRRLGESVSRSQAEVACVKSSRFKDLENCIFDVMASGDIEMALNGL